MFRRSRFRAARNPLPTVVLGAVLAGVLLASACASRPRHTASSTPGAPQPAAVLTVAGNEVNADGVGTVGEALIRAGVTPKAGALLGAVSHQPIKPDAYPATITLNGSEATLDTVVGPGDVVDIVDGKDVIEDIVTVREPGSGGVEVVQKGAQSGQVVARKLEPAPSPPAPHSQGPAKPPASQAGVAHVAKGQVALTFDDGPWPNSTAAVLDLLAKHNVKATFCVIGVHAEKHPELVKRVVAEGHTLCNHTQNHDTSLPKKPADQIRWAIATGRDTILRASGGKAPVFYRAPGGAWSDQVNAEARANGETLLKWTVDTEDWKKGATKQSILALVDRQLGGGGIILMHDGGGDRAATLAALETLLQTLPAKGYQFVIPSH
jgi:peptidoglycan/xylan/chitin deacetylase (PgdA/CDA1 family)